MSNRIVLLHTIQQYNEYNSINDKNKDLTPTIIIAFDIELRILLNKQNKDYKVPEFYLSEENGEEIDNAAIFLADNWHKDLFKFNSVSLGLLVQMDLKYYFIGIIRSILTILNIIHNENPLEIIAIDDSDLSIRDFNNLLNLICNKNKILVKIIPTRSSVESSKYNIRNYMILLKKYVRIASWYLFFKYGMEMFSNFVRSLKYFKLKLKNRNLKRILMIGAGYHNTILNKLSKKNYILHLQPIKHPGLVKKDLINIIFRNEKGIIKYFEDYVDRKIQHSSKIYFHQLSKKWSRIIETSDFQEIFTYKGIDFWQVAKEKIQSIMLIEFKRLIENILRVRKIIEKEKFDLGIFAADVTEFPMLFSILLSKYNIPTIVIQHGITGHPIGYLPSYSKIFLSWGRISKEWLINNGINPKKIVIVGSPRFDNYILMNQNQKFKSEIKKAVFNYFKIPLEKKLVILTTNFINLNRRHSIGYANPFEVEKIFEYTLKSIKNLPNAHLIIKLHGECMHDSVPVQMVERFKIKDVSIIKNFPIEYLLAASDCLITVMGTTTAIEALILEKPVIIIRFRKNIGTKSYEKYSIGFEVSNYEELNQILKEVLKKKFNLNEKHKEFLNDYLYKLDGLSSKRVLNYINTILNKS